MSALDTSLFHNGRAALLLVVVACLTPDRARAECGSYVTILNAPANPDDRSAPAPTMNEAELPKVPCSGPNCSGSPKPPPPLVAVAPLTLTAADATHLPHPVQPREARGAFGRDHTSHDPIRRPVRVFHPPPAARSVL